MLLFFIYRGNIALSPNRTFTLITRSGGLISFISLYLLANTSHNGTDFECTAKIFVIIQVELYSQYAWNAMKNSCLFSPYILKIYYDCGKNSIKNVLQTFQFLGYRSITTIDFGYETDNFCFIKNNCFIDNLMFDEYLLYCYSSRIAIKVFFLCRRGTIFYFGFNEI